MGILIFSKVTLEKALKPALRSYFVRFLSPGIFAQIWVKPSTRLNYLNTDAPFCFKWSVLVARSLSTRMDRT